jgi:mannose-6-phosphate isomerase
MTSPLSDPLIFQPIFRRYLWGGRRLATMLGKSLGTGNDYAESWEVVDHHQDQSVVLEGPLAGQTLHQLVCHQAHDLFGKHAEKGHAEKGRLAMHKVFPLLMKFLDANRTLSVQVHPTDEQAALLTPPDLGKTEAWVVLAAEPESQIYAGLECGVTREQFRRAMEEGNCASCLHAIQPEPGDCFYLPAGTVHAIGAGLVIAEIQQASDTTFRLFDWNRVGADGKSRPLHIEQGLATIDFTRGPVKPQRPRLTEQTGRQRLIKCDYFVLDRCLFHEPFSVGGDNRFHLLAVLEGTIDLAGIDMSLSAGHTLLLPAAAGARKLVPLADLANGTKEGRGKQAVVLDIYLP